MSAVKRPTHNLAKFLVSLLELINANVYTVKNSFKFAKRNADQDPGRSMTSLDVEFLFTNIPLENIIGVSCDSLFSDDAKVNNINRIEFERILRVALQNKFLNF